MICMRPDAMWTQAKPSPLAYALNTHQEAPAVQPGSLEHLDQLAGCDSAANAEIFA